MLQRDRKWGTTNPLTHLIEETETMLRPSLRIFPAAQLDVGQDQPHSLSFFPPSIVACQDCSETQPHSGKTFLHIWWTDNGAPSPFTWPNMVGTLCRSLSFFLSHTHTHMHKMRPFIQVDAVRGGSQGKLIKLKAGPAVCWWAAETQTSQHLSSHNSPVLSTALPSYSSVLSVRRLLSVVYA